ncbi:hypothetical protein QUB29_26430 [Microcoleus sp. B4b_D2]|uniref:hypothetical protein n=1 Tax=Microcoleus sp. B4b_D2 TaxID=3055310 RepID=UPI002FD5637A
MTARKDGRFQALATARKDGRFQALATADFPLGQSENNPSEARKCPKFRTLFGFGYWI